MKDHFKIVRHSPRNFACLRAAVENTEESCGRFTDYSLKWVYVLANLCEEGVDAGLIGAAAQKVCEMI